MANKLTTKKPLFGNRRSHALNATKKQQKPNLEIVFKEEQKKNEVRRLNAYPFYHDGRIERFIDLFNELFINCMKYSKSKGNTWEYVYCKILQVFGVEYIYSHPKEESEVVQPPVTDEKKENKEGENKKDGEEKKEGEKKKEEEEKKDSEEKKEGEKNGEENKDGEKKNNEEKKEDEEKKEMKELEGEKMKEEVKEEIKDEKENKEEKKEEEKI